MLSGLRHPRLAPVYAADLEGSTPFLVQEYVPGEDVEHMLRSGRPLPADAVRTLLRDLAEAIAYLHARDVLHRDVKPANVFLAHAGGSERAVLLDFGLVKQAGDAAISRITVTGAAVGTPMYMSPEQARGDAVDARSDVYGLAAVLFEMVTGAPPFLDRTLASVYARLLTTPAPSASSVADHPLPAELDPVLARALAKSPDERFADVRALLAAIGAIPSAAVRTA